MELLHTSLMAKTTAAARIFNLKKTKGYLRVEKAKKMYHKNIEEKQQDQDSSTMKDLNITTNTSASSIHT